MLIKNSKKVITMTNTYDSNLRLTERLKKAYTMSSRGMLVAMPPTLLICIFFNEVINTLKGIKRFYEKKTIKN